MSYNLAGYLKKEKRGLMYVPRPPVPYPGNHPLRMWLTLYQCLDGNGFTSRTLYFGKVSPRPLKQVFRQYHKTIINAHRLLDVRLMDRVEEVSSWKMFGVGHVTFRQNSAMIISVNPGKNFSFYEDKLSLGAYIRNFCMKAGLSITFG